MKLKDKKVLLTGSTGGIGAALAQKLAAKGARLILTDLNEAELQKQAAELGPAVLSSFTSDLSGPAGCDAVYEAAREFAEPLDVLVNNAGITFIGPYSDIPREKHETLMQINLLSPMRLTHLFLAGMRKANTGHIVNIASMAGITGAGLMASYSASKFGIRGFGEGLNAELGSTDINVTNVYPFFTRTAILDSERHGDMTDEKLPDFLISETSDVAGDIIYGIEKNTLHVHPGIAAKSIDFMNRVSPELVNMFQFLLPTKKEAK